METYTTFEEIKQEWQHIKNQNIKNIEFKILAIDKNVLIVEWLFEEYMTTYDGIYEVVIINDENEILLQKRSRYKRANPSKWGICGGKVDLGETPLDAGIRETFEEIGIRLKKDEFKFLSMDTNEKSHFTVYYVRKNVDVDECQIQQEELEEVRYFKIEELKELDNEGFEWLENYIKFAT